MTQAHTGHFTQKCTTVNKSQLNPFESKMRFVQNVGLGGATWWMGPIQKNIHPLTPILLNVLPLSPFSICNGPRHPLYSAYVLDSPLGQPLSRSSFLRSTTLTLIVILNHNPNPDHSLTIPRVPPLCRWPRSWILMTLTPPLTTPTQCKITSIWNTRIHYTN